MSDIQNEDDLLRWHYAGNANLDLKNGCFLKTLYD